MTQLSVMLCLLATQTTRPQFSARTGRVEGAMDEEGGLEAASFPYCSFCGSPTRRQLCLLLVCPRSWSPPACARGQVYPHPTCREKRATPQQHAGAKPELAPLSVNGFTQISKAVKEPRGGTAYSLTPFTFQKAGKSQDTDLSLFILKTSMSTPDLFDLFPYF